jgi:ADP-ribose pyrophosphatase YjhB (NUDIX family)
VTARFCIRCGRRLRSIVDDGRRRRRCLRCGWTFYDNPVPAVVAVIIDRGRVLLGRRARPPYAGTWDLPGGFLESEETPEAGLDRELREELGVGVRSSRLVGYGTDRYGRGGVAVLALIYRVRPTSWRFRAADDVTEVRWFPERRVPFREIAFTSLRRTLRAYLRGRRRPARARSS